MKFYLIKYTNILSKNSLKNFIKENLFYVNNFWIPDVKQHPSDSILIIESSFKIFLNFLKVEGICVLIILLENPILSRRSFLKLYRIF